MLHEAPSRPRLGALNRRLRIGAPVAVVVVLFLTAVGLGLQAKRRVLHDYDSGPLQTGSDTTTRIVVDVGQPFTFGGIVVYNTTAQPIVLDEIRLVPPTPPGMEILAIEVAGGDRRIGFVGADHGYAPTDLRPYLRPYRKALVPPERRPEGREGTEIVFGLQLNQPGMFGFEHVDVDYRVGKKRHRVRLEDGFLACAPPSAYPEGCDHEALSGRDP
jgi:hypothetical protein